MDGSDFDSLTHTFAASISRRVTLGGLIVGLGLALEEAVVGAIIGKGNGKGKGRGNKKGRGGNNRKNNKKKKKEHCTSVGESCTFTVHPCCGDTVCCDPTGSGLFECLTPGECCAGNTCSQVDNSDCSPGCTCQQRDGTGMGKCLLAQ